MQLQFDYPEYPNQSSHSWTVSEIDFVYTSKVPQTSRTQIRNSDDMYKIMLQHWNTHKIDFIEQFKVAYLNRNNSLLYIAEISTGGKSSTVADPGIILAGALRLNATAMVICHNHPSGNLKQSTADERMTKTIKEACALFNIQLTDHLIISREGFFSFADNGLL